MLENIRDTKGAFINDVTNIWRFLTPLSRKNDCFTYNITQSVTNDVIYKSYNSKNVLFSFGNI